MEDPDFWKMVGKIAVPCSAVLLGAVVAYATQRERRRKGDATLSKDKPSFLRELASRLKDPNKPTGR